MEKQTEENRLMDPGGRRESEMYGESNMETHNMVCKNRQPMGICLMTQGTQTGALN